MCDSALLPGNGQTPCTGTLLFPDALTDAYKYSMVFFDVPTGRHRLFGGGCVSVAVALGLVVVRVGVTSTPESRGYTAQPFYAIWSGLVLLQVVVWAIIGAASTWWWRLIRACTPADVRPPRVLFRDWALTSLALAVGLLAPTLAMQLPYERSYPDNLDLRVACLGAFAAMTMSVPIVALAAIRRVASRMSTDYTPDLAEFRFLWQAQRILLGALGMGLAANVLATAAKIQANNAFNPAEGPALPDVPSAYVIVLGALYGAILLIAYLPAHVTTRHVGEQLTATLAGTPAATTPEDWLASAQRQHQFATLLGLDEGIWERIQRAAGLLAPLLTALVTTLLPDVKL
jgi:hypothetical protein